MKKIKLVLSFLIILSISLYAQESTYFDAPFGGGGGYTPGWYFPNMDAVNTQLASFGVPALSNSGFYTSGGAGFIYLGFLENFRIGGMGFSGSTSTSSMVNGTNREVIYSLGGGGLTVEYTLPFIKNIAVSVGTIIGGGSMDIEIYNNSSSFNWNTVWSNAQNATSKNINKNIKNSYWMISPTLNVDIPFYRFVSFRIGAGYQIELSDSWKIDNGRELTGVPSNLNGNSFFIQTGIFIGLFSY